MSRSQLIVIVGPTGAGKTDLSVRIASHYGAPILSTDSRQIYRELPIGTAQPSFEQLHAVEHHFIASHNITQEFNCGAFESAALQLLETLFRRGRRGVAVGGRKQRPFDIVKIGVTLPREELYARIDRRVDAMLEAGLEEEARRMLPYRSLNALQTVGYREFFDYFDGTVTRDEAITLIKRNSRRYAKRQLTWFRRDAEIRWFSPFDTEGVIAWIDTQSGAGEY